MTPRMLCTAALAVGLLGCQRPAPPSTSSPAPPKPVGFAYPFKDVPPIDVDNEIRFYRDKLKQLPKDPAVQVSLAQVYLAKAQSSGDVSYYGEAEKLVQSSLKLRPKNNHGAELVLASLCESKHDFTGSVKIVEAMYKQDSGDFDARALLSNSLLELGRIDEALVLSKGTYTQMPLTSSALQLSRVLIASGQDEVAARLIESAIQREQPQENKASARLRSLLGEMKLRHGQLAEAEQFFHASLQAIPDNPQTLEDLARLKLRQGQTADAEKLYLAAFAKTQHPILLRQVAKIKLAQGKGPEAQEMLKQAESLLKPEVARGSFGHARDLARVLLDLDRPQEALELLQQEEKQRQDWRLYELKAIALEVCKRREEALLALKKAISTGVQEPSLYQRAALWETSAGWSEKLKAIDPSYTPSLLE